MKSFKQLWLSVAKEVLEKTKDGEVPDYLWTTSGIKIHLYAGICDMTMSCAEVAEVEPPYSAIAWLWEKFQQWPRFSGNHKYPIPCDGEDPQEAFDYASNTQMWSPFHPYGALRRELLEFLIQEMEKEDEDETKWIIET